MNFESYIRKSKKRLAQHLSDYLLKKETEKLPNLFKKQKFLSTLENFSTRGKMIRGVLFLLMAEGLGVKIQKKHYDIAAAIELTHSSLLIQDDIIDQDKTRRGSDTVYYLYEKEANRLKAYNPYHYGVSTAMMIADISFYLAMDLLSNFEDPTLAELLKYFSNEIRLVAIAESVDSIFGQTPINPQPQDIYDVYLYKTARYTFSMPFVMGAIIAEADKKTITALSNLGQAAGLIFQLKDDQIGLFGDEEKTGKPVGGDIRENKKTIIRHLLYKSATKKDSKVLDACFGNENTGSETIKIIKGLYDKYRIKDQIDKEISDLSKTVDYNVRNLKLFKNQKKILEEFLEYNLKRTY